MKAICHVNIDLWTSEQFLSLITEILITVCVCSFPVPAFIRHTEQTQLARHAEWHATDRVAFAQARLLLRGDGRHSQREPHYILQYLSSLTPGNTLTSNAGRFGALFLHLCHETVLNCCHLLLFLWLNFLFHFDGDTAKVKSVFYTNIFLNIFFNSDELGIAPFYHYHLINSAHPTSSGFPGCFYLIYYCSLLNCSSSWSMCL